MQFRYFFYLLFTLLSFDGLLGYYTNSIDRALDNLFSDEINKNILIDYFDQMGSYRDWKQVTSVKLDGNIIFEDTSYKLSIYKKFPDKIKVTIQELKQSYPKVTQIMNGSKVHCFIENAENNSQMIDPIFNLKEDLHIMPKLMHLLMIENNSLQVINKSNLNSETVEIELLNLINRNIYKFSIDKASKAVTQYSIKDYMNETNVFLEDTISNGRLKYPRKIKISTEAMKAELFLNKLSTNVGLTSSFFEASDKTL